MIRQLLALVVGLGVVAGGLWFFLGRPHAPPSSDRSLKVLTYSSFMNSWGPGPEIARRFHDTYGITVEYQDAGDAGLLLEKLKLFPVDAVVGLDRASLALARSKAQWRSIGADLRTAGNASASASIANSPSIIHADEAFREPSFVAYDWAPLALVYRKGEIVPPTSLHDLADERFRGAIALEDPRTSTPGLNFLLWTLQSFASQDEAFKFLASLKPNIQSVSPSWSTAYGAFTHKQAKLVVSYMTSPIYHLIEEKNPDFAAAVFPEGHIAQVEYAGIPTACTSCDDAAKFVEYLLNDETQKLIMKKNFMMPIEEKVSVGTPFAAIPIVRLIDAGTWMEKRDELFEKWRALGL